MPSFNQFEFIEESILSVINQNYPSLEFFVIDGGSTDGSVDIIKKYEKNITWWVSEKDNGQSHALNKGFNKATGEFICWLNSDDIFFPNAFFSIARAFEENPGAALISGTGVKIDGEGNVIKQLHYRSFDKKLIRKRFYILQQSTFFRRKVLKKLGFVDETLHFTMDWDLILRVVSKCCAHSINVPIGKFRIYNTTKTQTGSWERKREIAMVARRHNGIFDRNFIGYYIFYCTNIFINSNNTKVRITSQKINNIFRSLFNNFFKNEYMV